MPTDTERREVARRLREYVDLSDDWWADTYSGFYVEKCAFGNVERHRESELFARLADLIEPTRNCSEPTRTCCECDRDALLELVKELELGAQCFVGRKWTNVECERMAKHLADYYEMIARRIRKALGVKDGN